MLNTQIHNVHNVQYTTMDLTSCNLILYTSTSVIGKTKVYFWSQPSQNLTKMGKAHKSKYWGSQEISVPYNQGGDKQKGF